MSDRPEQTESVASQLQIPGLCHRPDVEVQWAFAAPRLTSIGTTTRAPTCTSELNGAILLGFFNSRVCMSHSVLAVP